MSFRTRPYSNLVYLSCPVVFVIKCLYVAEKINFNNFYINQKKNFLELHKCAVLNHDFSQFCSVEGDEVFRVGLVIVEDHKHGGLLLVVHHTVEAVGGV